MLECSTSLIQSCEQISDSLLSLAMALDTDSMRGNVFLRVFGGGLRSHSGLNVAQVVSGGLSSAPLFLQESSHSSGMKFSRGPC